MLMSITSHPGSARMTAWRRQIGHRHELADRRGPRPFAVISYRVRSRPLDGRYVRLRDLTFVALFDERFDTGEMATRLVGVAAAVDPDGLRFGGAQLSRFEKNLRLAPGRDRRGARLTVDDGEFFEFALSLECYLERCSRHPFMPRRKVPRLPTLDAGNAADESSLVDLTTLPKRQVIRLDDPQRDLVGRVGSTVFDFVHTRFRPAH